MSAYVRHPTETYVKVLPGVTMSMGAMISKSKADRNRTGRTAQENGTSLPDPRGGRES